MREVPKVFWLHFNRLQVSKEDPHVWTVHTAGACIPAKVVLLEGVSVETVYKGPDARQPRAFLRGRGVVLPPDSAGVVLIRPARKRGA